MTSTATSRRRTATAVAWLLVVATLAAIAVAMMLRRPPALAVLGQVPPFSLLDQQGQEFSSSSLAGRVWVANFLYTSCPGPCPVMVEKLAQLRERVSPEDLAIVSFSVDPDIDTVDVTRDYASDHRIKASQSWWLLTGPRQQVLELIQKGFSSAVMREDAAEGSADSASGPIIHSTGLVLVDGEGQIRGTYSSEDAADLDRLEEDAKSLPSHPSSKR